MRRAGTAAIAIACGSTAACLYLAATFGTPGGLVLVYMTQLPLFIAGLWLGAGAAALAGLTATLVLLAASDLLGAAVLLLGGPEGLQAALKSVVAEVLDRLAQRPMPNRDQAAELLAMVIPGMV